ncbi:MAG: hypothetical protein EBT13_11295, partial [Rhodobacteraceae bacterium]|nr:hypothetical protein [Paracoccaceae bacterium]
MGAHKAMITDWQEREARILVRMAEARVQAARAERDGDGAGFAAALMALGASEGELVQLNLERRDAGLLSSGQGGRR